MSRFLVAGLVASLLYPAVVWAQQTDEDTQAEGSLQQDNSLSSIRERAPGTWITAARARHNLLIQARVGNPRSGQPAGTTEGLFDDGSGSATGSTGGLSGLLDLVSQFSGLTGGTSSLGGLSDILGSLGQSQTPTSTGGQSQPTSAGTAGGSGTSLADLLSLRDQLLGDSGQTSATQKESSATQQERTRALRGDDSGVGGAIGRLPKVDLRAQSQNGERKFVARWAERMAQTFFTSLAVGFRSQPFIDLLKGLMRPVFLPGSAAQTDGTTDAGSTDAGGASGSGTDGAGGSGGGTDGTAGTDSSGGGIEDQPPPDESDGDDSGSIV